MRTEPMREIEQHLFRIIQRKQHLFIKILAGSLAVSLLFLALSAVYRWPLFFAILPLGLTGPFIVNVMTARCPHCQKPLHRSPLAVFRRLDRCARCGFRDV